MMNDRVRAELRSLMSIYVDLETFAPRVPFGIPVTALVGPVNGPGEETFDFTLCTTEWFAENMDAPFVQGRHYLFTKRYDYAALERYVRDYCAACEGENWAEVGLKLGRLGHWEFEDYRP